MVRQRPAQLTNRDHSVYEFDSQGYATSLTDAQGRVTLFTYVMVGGRQQISTIESEFLTTTFTYSGNQLVAVSDSRGNTVNLAYTGNRLATATQKDPDGPGPLPPAVTTYNYNFAGLISSIDHPGGLVTNYSYETTGQFASIQQPGRSTDHFESPQAAALDRGVPAQTTTDARGIVTATTFDQLGNPILAVNGLGAESRFLRDENGLLLSATLADRDGNGPLESAVYEFTYDARGNVASKTTPLGTTTYEYDSLQRVVQIDEPDPNGGPLDVLTSLFAYTAAGQIASVTTAKGTTSYEYDSRNRLTKVTLPDPDGAGPALAPWTVYAYDDAGRITSETDRLGQQTSYVYDNIGQVIKVVDAEDGETVYSYDVNGNRLSLTDPVGNTTNWVYDSLNRPVSETNELNQARYFQYDAAGNLSQRTDRNGRVIQHAYDYLSRPIVETWWDGQTLLHTLTYQYDDASQLVSAYDSAAAYDFTYDALGRNTQIVHDLAALSFEITFDQTFDNLNRRTELATTIDATADLLSSYQYDYFSRITQVTQAGQSGGNAVAEKRVDFSYDSHFSSQFATITRYPDLAGTKLVADSEFDYDASGRLASIDHTDGTTALAGYSYGHDAASRITQFLVAGYLAEDAVYSYDATSQLTGADRSGTANDESYLYDENGNRNGGGYVVGDNNQILSDGTFSYTFDAEGNRLTKLEIASGKLIEYSWDHRNRLTQITSKNSLGAIAHQVTYTYDIFNRRIVKSIDVDGAGPNPAEQEIFIHDGLRSERGGAGDHILLRFDGGGDLTDRYLHGPAVDQILAEEAVTNPAAPGDVLWALTDRLGTVRDLVEYDTVNDESTVANHIVYDAFGRIVAETDPAAASLFGFTGRERDIESDLQYNRARYYDAALGRWLSEDPIGFAAGDANLNRYVTNGVVNGKDPSGFEEIAIDVIAFIPRAWVMLAPGIWLEGDNRGPGESPDGSFRIRTRLVFTMDADSLVQVDATHDVGESAMMLGCRLPGIGGWFASTTFTGVGASYPDQSATRTPDGVLIRVSNSGAVPRRFVITALAPFIDYSLTGFARHNGESIYVSLSFRHDGFPAYQVFANDQPVYCHLPGDSGQTPLSLYGSGEFRGTLWFLIDRESGVVTSYGVGPRVITLMATPPEPAAPLPVTILQ